VKENSDFIQKKRLLKVSQVASILNVSRAMTYRLMQQGEIRSVHISGSRRVRPEDLERYIEKNLTPWTQENRI